MPIAARRPAAVAPPPVEGVNFLSLDFYSGGFALPPGDYAMFFDARLHAYTKANGQKGQENLGVMATCYPLAGGDPHELFLSLGGKAKLAFAPDPETGKKLLPIPGAQAVNLGRLSNFNVFLKSMYDCGMPTDPALVSPNDLTTIDGVWVTTANIPAPEERKSFGKGKTGEAALEEDGRKGDDQVTVIVEIKDDGKPWEGTGGMPETADAAATPAPKPTAKAAVKPAAAAPKAAVKPPTRAAAPAPVEEEVVEEATDGEEIQAAALEVATALLEASPAGITTLILKTKSFTAVQKKFGDETAQAVAELYSTPAGMDSILGLLGYKVIGPSVKPA